MEGDGRPAQQPTVVDQDRLRFSQGVVAVGALVAYVFRAPVLDPVLAAAVIVAMGPAPGRDVLAVPYDRWVAPRRAGRRAPRPTEPIGRARLVQVTTVIALGAAGFWWLVGALGLAELFTLIGAAIAALYATTGIVVVASVVETVRRARRRSTPTRRRSEGPSERPPDER